MPFGYQQQNADGFVQVDETYSNYSLVASGTATTGNSVTFPTQATPPIVAIGVVGAGNFASMTVLETSNFTVISSSGVNFSYPYRIYAPVGGTNTGGYGLQVFNASGGLTFDSKRNYLAIRSVTIVSPINDFPVTFAGNNVTAYTLNHNTGGSPFVFLNNCSRVPCRIVGTGFNYFSMTTAVCMNTANQLTICERTSAQGSLTLTTDTRYTTTLRVVIGV